MATKVRKYKKVSCHTTKTAAKAAASRLRASGSTATVKATKKGACVYSAGKAKVSGTRRKRRTTRK